MRQIITILRMAGNLWPYYLIVTVSSVLIALANQLLPFIVKWAADLVVAATQGHADYTQAVWLAIGFFAIDVSVTLLTNWGQFYGDVMTVKLRKQLSERYYKHMLSLPQSYFDTELTGKIISRLSRTIAELTNFMQFVSSSFFQMVLTMAFTLIVVGYYSWEVAVLLFAIYPLFIWITSISSKKWVAYEHQKNTELDTAQGRFTETIAQAKVVKSFVQEARELAVFARHMDKNISIGEVQFAMWHRMDIWRRLILNTIFGIIMAYIFWQTTAGRFSVGEMLLLIQMAQLMRMPLFSMSFIVEQIQHAIAGSKDYIEALAIQPDIADKPGAQKLQNVKGEIKYTDVAFSYNKGEQVLGDITFGVKPGQKVALVGESGEGKTTITNLLMRLYESSSGQITIDGTNINDITQSSLREHIAVVFQEPALFSGTIRENIGYAKPSATDAQITAAAKAANADEFIAKLPGGYETQIGERGVRLSGGQKQRIAIARALLKDAPILILDEATSSLDSKAELQVQEALNTLMHGRTTLIIAHRLSTIAHVDEIVTIKNGAIDEIGTPTKLAKTGGIYAQLLDLQMGATEAAKKKLKAFEISS